MTIPASNIVAGQPGVLSAGGNPLALNGLVVTQSLLLPSTGVTSFVSADAAGDYFGESSPEYAASQYYFAGYDNSTLKPGLLYFAPYAASNRAAFVRSGSLAGMALTQLQALTGTLILTVDGVVKTSSTINLAAAASFSAAATTIAAAFTGAPLVCTWDAVLGAFTLTSATTGASSTITYATGTLATGLKFTSATGAILSQGIVADTPSVAMNRILTVTQNWVDFTTMFEPDLANKTLFANWVQTQNQRYAYVPWDTDAQAIVNGSTSDFASIVFANNFDGIVPVYNTLALAMFALGVIACIDNGRTNGRITTAFKSQAGFTPTVTDAQIAATLEAKGYSFYGAYATANDQFNFFYPGKMSGKWKWFDTFVNQVYMNSQFQLAELSLFTQIPSIPYNQAGYDLVRAALITPINAAKNFGAIRAGVTLTESQKAQVNQATGVNAAPIIEAEGWYLQITDPGAQARALRQTPIITFYYTDGGAIQRLNIPSINIM
jgi:hypothetical protein